MEYFPAPREKLTEQFARLPGVGRKSAQRLGVFRAGRALGGGALGGTGGGNAPACRS